MMLLRFLLVVDYVWSGKVQPSGTMSNAMTVIQDKLYPFKVWFTTIIGGSFLFVVYDFMSGNGTDLGDSVSLFLLLVSANLVLSVPGLLIYLIAFWRLNPSRLPIRLKKWLYVLVAFFLVLFTWYGINNLFGRDVFFSSKSMFIYLDYLSCIIASSFVFGRNTATAVECH